MLKKFYVSLMAAVLTFSILGCAKDSGKNNYGNSSVDKVIQEQISKADSEERDTEETVESAITETVTETIATESVVQEEETTTNADGIDVDLSVMDMTMTYATVYQIMISPDEYVGKTIRVKGQYYPIYYEETGICYQYALIKDATGCCTQGMEFVWEDGNHVYPDEYPAEGTEILVTGIFETYMEDGDPNLYCRLKDASMVMSE